MTRGLLRLGAALVCLWAAGVQAATLLWVTTDVTPPARTAMIERLAREVGLDVLHVEFPLQGPPSLSVTERERFRNALAKSPVVWIDVPHATLAARLDGLLGTEIGSRDGVVWATSGAGQRGAAAYLQAGGERNIRHAVALAAARMKALPAPALPAPQPWPTQGVYHPDATGLFADATAFAAWQRARAGRPDRPVVAVLVHRHHFVNGGTAWLDDWLRLFEREGLSAYAAFGQQVDATSLAPLIEVDGRALPSVLVTQQLLSQGAALQPVFKRWNVPVLATQLYRLDDAQAWQRDPVGLTQGDVPFYLAQPEAAGTIDPMLVTAQADRGGRTELIERQALAVVAKAKRLVTLQRKAAGDKRVVAMVYNYPPGGTNFGASFLNVPRSLERVSQGLADAGYRVDPLDEAQWVSRLPPLLGAYYPDHDLRKLLDTDQAAALPLAAYERWWATLPPAVRERIEAQWGPPGKSRYVVSHRGERVFVIPRLRAGSLSVMPQPPREETLRLGQNPFMHRSRTPLSHHYLATYLWGQQEADVLLHFGTHGTQEWAPGKARGLDVFDDAMLPLGDLPVVYPYIVDNLGEALTAKRRGRALLLSHHTPSFSPAGFEAKMAHMHELMHEWETVDAGPVKQALERRLVAEFVEHQLHRDLGWSAERIAAEFEPFLELLHPYLDSLAQSSQPQGLAVFGRIADPAQRKQTILQALRKPLIDALGEDIDEAFLIRYDSVAAARPARWLDVALRDADAASRLDLRPAEPEGYVPNRAARKPIDTPALLKLAQRAQTLEALLATENEMPALLHALKGGFIEAAYGGDPIRNPESLPTGRNLTGLDPSRLPTRQAYDVATTLFDDWLKEWREAHGGKMPTRLALSLWAGETLRHQGVMEAQAMVALGVQPVWDDTGRPTRLRVMPLDELKRPRVDVLLSVTGSYRDQFPALMTLVDQAVAQASTAEPGNAVAANTAQVERELRQRGVAAPQAAALSRARVFGNASGDYGTGLSDAVQSAGIQPGDPRLGALFLQRMSQPYVNGMPLADVPPAAAEQALGAHLRQTQAALLSRTSHLYAMVTSDDPFQYLGGLAAAARSAGKTEPLALYVSQLQDVSEVHTTSAARSIALEMQSRYLHPGWIKAQQAEGYSGTLQVVKALQFTWGWQVTAPDTVRPDHWQSFHDVLVKDRHGLGVPQWMRSHPQAYGQALDRLVQAARLGYWQPDAATRAQLDAAVQDAAGAVAPARAQVARPDRVTASPPQPAAPLVAPTPEAPTRLQPPQGVLLQRQPDEPPRAAPVASTLATLLGAALMALIVASGAAWQARGSTGATVRLRRRPA